MSRERTGIDGMTPLPTLDARSAQVGATKTDRPGVSERPALRLWISRW